MPKAKRLDNFLDYFIPEDALADVEQHRRMRMFMLSHVFGPVLGSSLPIYMFVMDIARDARVLVFFLSIVAFWMFPILLRATGRYKLLSMVSIQNLGFCVIWACYSFGGLNSPFLPWLLILPLLAFLYLPQVGWVRNALLVQIFGNTALLLWLCTGGVELPYINLAELEVIGMISMAAVAIYFAMMALYFAKMFDEQREFGRELTSLIASSDNLRNLTEAAEQASAAKANFIASMSHELRTPLNAIIGYSQLLLEEAEDEGDTESSGDLRHVHGAGEELLYLIDHILDYSRIDAGKMPVVPSFNNFAEKLHVWKDKLEAAHPGIAIKLGEISGGGKSIALDWNAMEAMLANIVSGLSAGGDGQLRIDCAASAKQVELSFQARDAAGEVIALDLNNELFVGDNDLSASKYGNSSIEFALAGKFAQLIGGEISQSYDRVEGQKTSIHFAVGEDQNQSKQRKKAA